ncbi:MAG: hypothetical protein O7G85_04665 [Planctomycetota bacterium]|nr:hypothetical protein [Planctomycetota bacterium]
MHTLQEAEGLCGPTLILCWKPALAAANPGDRILVGQGTYIPASVFLIDKDVTILGGHAGILPSGEIALDPFARDISGTPSILSGDDALSAFIVIDGVSEDGRLDGFTIEGGRSPDLPSGASFAPAGAMTIVDSSIDIVRCTFHNNSSGSGTASGRGGAVSVSGQFDDDDLLTKSAARFINCTFHDNVASSGGAIAMLERGDLVNDEPTFVKFVNCLIYDNRTVKNVISAVSAEGSGGAVFIYEGAEVDIVNCTIKSKKGIGGP